MTAQPPAPQPPLPQPQQPPVQGNFMMGVIGGVVGACVGGAVYYLIAAFVLKSQAIPLLLVGPIVGGAVRGFGKSPDTRLGWIALALTVAAIVAGFVAADAHFWTPYDPVLALRRLFSHIDLLLLSALSAYLALIMSVVRS